MKSISAKDAKNGFGRLIDIARAEPVTIEKHGRAVVVVMAVEAYEELLKMGGIMQVPEPVKNSSVLTLNKLNLKDH